MSGKNDKELDSKLMNFDGDRYNIVVLSSMWAKELKKKAEQFDLPVELFVPKDMLLLDDEERIARFVSENLPK